MMIARRFRSRIACAALIALALGIPQLSRLHAADPVKLSATVEEPRTPEAFAAALQHLYGLRADAPDRAEWTARVDRLAAQRDAELSGMFWYTDLNQAKAVAAREKKPILSLRLLGRLDEEFSCANSRFFRAILYADPTLSVLLRDSFVLHWESVRPVPTITIDFGDGRTLKRTITGNSIHYVLSPTGRVIDALPGLIAPRLFETQLRRIVDNPDAMSFRRDGIISYRNQTIASTPRFDAYSLALPAATNRRLLKAMPKSSRFTAVAAAPIASSKSLVERPLIVAVRNPMPALAEDSRRNLTKLRPVILTWLQETPSIDVSALNARVYRDLFLTPLDDPNMGLDVPDAFSGLAAGR